MQNSLVFLQLDHALQMITLNKRISYTKFENETISCALKLFPLIMTSSEGDSFMLMNSQLTCASMI